MDELIQLIAGKTGLSAPQAKTAAGSVLQFIKGKAAEADTKELFGKIPGAQDLAAQAAPASGGGAMGGLMQSASSALGGNLGSAAGLLGGLKQAGVDPSQAGGVLSAILGFIRSKGGDALVGRLMQQIPELGKLAG